VDPEVKTAICAARFDEVGLPWGPDPSRGRDARRRQTVDRGGKSSWAVLVRQKQTNFLRAAGLLACDAEEGEKRVCKVHALLSLPTPGYDPAATEPQYGDQEPHTDESLREIGGRSDGDMPLSTLLAIMPGTRLRICSRDGEWTVVHLEPGDLLAWRGDVCHHGMGYADTNIRVHAYVYPPSYHPSGSSINGCPE